MTQSSIFDKLWWAGWRLYWLLMAFIVSMAMTSCWTVPAVPNIEPWIQPAEIQYNSFDPYKLQVIQDGTEFEFPLSRKPTYALFISGSHVSYYGHVFRISLFNHGDHDLKEYLDRTKVTWSSDGVEFSPPSGHKVFLPKEMFVGGR